MRTIGTATIEPPMIRTPAIVAQRPVPRYVSMVIRMAPTIAIAKAAYGRMPVSVYCAFACDSTVNSPARRTLNAAP